MKYDIRRLENVVLSENAALEGWGEMAAKIIQNAYEDLTCSRIGGPVCPIHIGLFKNCTDCFWDAWDFLTVPNRQFDFWANFVSDDPGELRRRLWMAYSLHLEKRRRQLWKVKG